MFDDGPLEDADAAMNAAKAAALFGADTSAEEESGVASGASVRRMSTAGGNPEPLIPFPLLVAFTTLRYFATLPFPEKKN